MHGLVFLKGFMLTRKEEVSNWPTIHSTPLLKGIHSFQEKGNQPKLLVNMTDL